MQDFFDYKYLGTLAGATAATILIVEFIKDIQPIKKIPTRCLVLTIAFILVISVTLAKGEFIFSNIPLYIINALLVTSSAIGSWHTITNISSESIRK